MWTNKSYKLDKLAHKFKFPVLVQVSEGYYGNNEVDSFSAGDIIMFDQRIFLQKVTAKFVRELTETRGKNEKHKAEPGEILIPINYKGKVKVRNKTKVYENVRVLAKDFPRYVTLLKPLNLRGNDGKWLSLPRETTIELDRVIPPSVEGERGYLIVKTEINGYKPMKLYLDEKGMFRTTKDENEYYLREAIERYSLPRIVSFQDKKILSIYGKDITAGENEVTCAPSGTLQLRKVVQQKVLIGHCKTPYRKSFGQESNDPHSEETILVVPLDSLDIQEILVKVYQGELTHPIYNSLVEENENAFIRRSVEKAEGLYPEYLQKPRVIRFPDTFDDVDNVEDLASLLPRPNNTSTTVGVQLNVQELTITKQPQEHEKKKDSSEEGDEDSLGYVRPDISTLPTCARLWTFPRRSLRGFESTDVVHRRNQERVENHTKGAKTAHHITSAPNKICVTQPLRPNPKHFESVSSKHHGLHLELKKDTLGHLNGNDSYIDMHGMTEKYACTTNISKDERVQTSC